MPYCIVRMRDGNVLEAIPRSQTGRARTAAFVYHSYLTTPALYSTPHAARRALSAWKKWNPDKNEGLSGYRIEQCYVVRGVPENVK